MHRFFTTVLLGLAFVFAGCARRGMIVGLYDVPARALPLAAAAGFNAVTIAAGETNRLQFFGEASKAGLQVLAWPSLNSREGMRETARLDDHPALLGWYLDDEPDLNIVSPETLKQRLRKLRGVAQKPACVVVASGAAVEKYRGAANLMMVDSYPISWAPLAVVSREMRTARLASNGRPFLALLQAFDWSAFPQLLQTEQPQRPPTFEEMRCMAFLSMFHGARGLFFYSFRAGDWNIEDRPAVWEALTNTVAEVRRFAPIFRNRVSWWPAQTRYEGPELEMRNEIQEGRVALSLFHMAKKRDGLLPGYYFVAINTSPDPVAFSFRLPFRDVAQVRTPFGPDQISVKGGWTSKLYAGFEICIYGPIDRPLETRLLP